MISKLFHWFGILLLTAGIFVAVFHIYWFWMFGEYVKVGLLTTAITGFIWGIIDEIRELKNE